MEESERSRSRSPRRASRVEQVVGRWLRRSRDSLSRERVLDGKSDQSDGAGQQNFPVKVTVEVIRNAGLDSHGFTLSSQHPLRVRDVIAGGPADSRLLPGDQVLKVNNTFVEDLPSEQVEEMIRDCQDSLTLTILRHMSGPKSSLMTAEKKARLRRNPVKVRFAEEVLVNGHTQGNSLLFLPNVLKVYLENGQTKAFKFDDTTTVKDIVLTLKDKLSIRAIEHFSLVLEQQYSINKLLLLHEEELVQQVVQKKDSHDYRCLFRVCFVPRDPLELLQDDPVSFEYLFLQSVGDVLQERFAVEMKCNTALRLAALHMHERLASCGHTQRASIKGIVKEFGLESFISPTLLRNMREKDLKKALGFHLKKIQSLLEPRQKVISVSQARLAYLTQMGELISYSGRSYNATMLLQDRESLVSLLVGARYGLSQVLNHKLNMISTIIDFHYITRLQLLSESERVSILKIYLQDIQPLALLMDSVAAKDLACLLAGYCRLLVDPNMNVFCWGSRQKLPFISSEEGYLSHCASDSDESSEEDDPMEDSPSTHVKTGGERDEAEQQKRQNRVNIMSKVSVIVTKAEELDEDRDNSSRKTKAQSAEDEEQVSLEMFLETGWYHSDPRVNSSFSSLSSNSLSTLEDNYRGLSRVSAQILVPEEKRTSSQEDGASSLDVHHPYLLEVPDCLDLIRVSDSRPRPAELVYDKESGLCYAELSHMSDSLLSPPEASDYEEDLDDEMEDDAENGKPITPLPAKKSKGVSIHRLLVKSHSRDAFKENAKEQTQHEEVNASSSKKDFTAKNPLQIFRTSDLFKDSASESEDEFFDAQDRFTPPMTEREPADGAAVTEQSRALNMNIKIGSEGVPMKKPGKDNTTCLPSHLQNSAAPSSGEAILEGILTPPNGVTSMHDRAADKAHEKTKEVDNANVSQDIHNSHSHCNGDILGRNARLTSELIEMEPDTMEFKPVTSAGPPRSSPLITAIRQAPVVPDGEGENAEKRPKQPNGICGQKHANHMLVKAPGTPGTPSHISMEASKTRNGQGELEKRTAVVNGGRREETKQKNAESSATKHEPALPNDLPNGLKDMQEEGEKDVTHVSRPNGLSFHPWSQRNGVKIASPHMSKRVSLSHENLRERTDASKLRLTSLSANPTPSVSPSPSPSVPVKIPIIGDPSKSSTESILSSFSSKTRSSGRLSTTALRGKIQDLPWYLTRSQEILGTAALENSSSDTQGVDKAVDLHESCMKDTVVTALEDGPEEGAEVVIVKLKDGPQEVRVRKEDPYQANSSVPSELYKRLDNCKCEQPQSTRVTNNNNVNFGGPSPPCPATPPAAEPCGCHTVYTNCFSGDAEDNSGFDDELTVYEISRRNKANKPHQLSPAPLSSPSPNLLSLLRDSPRPLSGSSELSPLLSAPRPLDPHPSELGPLGDPLRSLQGRRYGTGQRGVGLKGGYASLHSDINELLLVLKDATVRAPPPGHRRCADHASEKAGHVLSESERCVVQTEARRLASGCQRATRVGWAPDDSLLSLGSSFGALVHLSAACLRVKCADCGGTHGDVDAAEALQKLQEIVGLYKEFVAAVEMAREGDGVRVLAKQCTVLISAVFCLTQLFRTRTPDTDTGHSELHLSF
ncbi:FERM and PDZ domain-containing protein 1 isoform X2 [Denticeps clupeoides]|uniref:FERM and PDZ domain-containing protein 1 isoform X2 n=1 Tax=Denticeps clupeoides TaxID=299321 RepID=UPI0010A39E20|nr:FERM and PDZ domain-containing protein 1-like isoform X2 [Denticeps clupeoides]